MRSRDSIQQALHDTIDFFDQAREQGSLPVDQWIQQVDAYFLVVEKNMAIDYQSNLSLPTPSNKHVYYGIDLCESLLRVEPMAGKKRAALTYKAWAIAVDCLLNYVLLYDDKLEYDTLHNHVAHFISDMTPTSRAWKHLPHGFAAQLYTLKTTKKTAAPIEVHDPWLFVLQGLYNGQKPESLFLQYAPGANQTVRLDVVQKVFSLWFSHYPEESIATSIIEQWMSSTNNPAIKNTYWIAYSNALAEHMENNTEITLSMVQWARVLFQKPYSSNTNVLQQALRTLDIFTNANIPHQCSEATLKEAFCESMQAWLESFHELQRFPKMLQDNSRKYLELAQKIYGQQLQIATSLDIQYSEETPHTIKTYWLQLMALMDHTKNSNALDVDFLLHTNDLC